MAFGRFFLVSYFFAPGAFAAFGRRDDAAPAMVRGKDSMVASEIDPGYGYQCSQSSQKIERATPAWSTTATQARSTVASQPNRAFKVIEPLTRRTVSASRKVIVFQKPPKGLQKLQNPFADLG